MLAIRQSCLVLIVCAILVACNDLEDQSEQPPDVYAQPVYCSLNTSEGYVIHPVKGDTVKPLLTADGDTLITGIPIKLAGKIRSKSELQPYVRNASAPRVIDIQNNTFKVSDLVETVPLNSQNVKSFEARWNRSTSITLNNQPAVLEPMSVGARFVEVSGKVPKPMPASLPQFKDSYTQNIRYLDVEQGMNSSRVRTLLQDNRGDLWFGTHGGGVTEYNSESFSFYTTEHGLNGNIVNTMYEDSQGSIWFGTWIEGISMFDGKTFFLFSANNYLDQPITSIMEDNQGNIWIGSGVGICRFDGSELNCFTELEDMPLKVSSIIKDRNGLLWFGTNQGILNYNGSEFTQYTLRKGLNSNGILALLEDNLGNLWIGTADQGLCMFNGDIFTYYNTRVGSNSEAINTLLQDAEGNIWIGTNGNGLVKFDGSSFTYITMQQGLSDNTILSVLEDREGQIWVGTLDGGVNVIRNHSFVHFTSLERVNASNVRAIREDDAGDYWFASWGGGILYYKDHQFYQYTTEHGLPSNTMWDMLIDNQGKKWFGGEGGLTSFDGRRFVNYSLENPVLSLLQDKNGTIWMGTGGMGLLSFDGQNFVQYSTKEGFNGDIIWSMTEDQQGNLWMATWGGGGVAKYDGEHFTFYTEREGLIHNDIWSVLEDRRGNVWFGSYGKGISVFDGEGFINIAKNQGLPNNIVSSLIEDLNGNIWVGTEKGLGRLEIFQDAVPVNDKLNDPDNISYKLINYSSSDGLLAEDFNVHSVYLDSRNRIWWGTGKSLVRLDLSKLEKEIPIPKISLEQIEIGGRFVDYTAASDSILGVSYEQVPSYTNLPQDLVIPFKQNHLTFHFTTNDKGFPHKNLYSYKMPGVSEFWSTPTNEAKADYRNIPYGAHRFLISAAGPDRQWSPPVEYTFTVLAPWWHTWYARAGYIILGIAGVTGLIRLRTANIKQKQKVLERMVEERTAQVVEQQKRSDELLLNILPANVARELKETGKIEPVHFEEVSILFADFKEFTNIVASIPSKKLILELNDIFQNFDDIMEKRGLEKIQTVGDAYVAAGGLPDPDPEHARKCVVAAKDMIEYLSNRNQHSSIKWKVRIGIHSGPITAGVVGKKKFAYDVFGDTVNVAARIESASNEGRINVSAYTHDLIKSYFNCEYRGKINAKGKGNLDMYFVMDNHLEG